jgi:hypothetical protein
MKLLKSILSAISFIWLCAHAPDWMVIMWILYFAVWLVVELQKKAEAAHD